MKRKDITPGEVYSLASFRTSRQGWPVMILSTDSYQRHHRTNMVDIAGSDRLTKGDYFTSAVGLIVVKLAFDMHTPTGEDSDGPLMDVLDFRAKVEQVRELASARTGLFALNESRERAWDDREHLMIRDAEGDILGHYELLTGLQMVQGPYIPLTLAQRAAELRTASYAAEHERQRVAAVATANELADRLDRLGITGYHVADWESPTRFAGLSFEDIETLIVGAENFYGEYPDSHPKYPEWPGNKG